VHLEKKKNRGRQMNCTPTLSPSTIAGWKFFSSDRKRFAPWGGGAELTAPAMHEAEAGVGWRRLVGVVSVEGSVAAVS